MTRKPPFDEWRDAVAKRVPSQADLDNVRSVLGPSPSKRRRHRRRAKPEQAQPSAPPPAEPEKAAPPPAEPEKAAPPLADATSPPLPAARGGRPRHPDRPQIEAMIDEYLANPGALKLESFFSKVEAWCKQREKGPPDRRTLQRWLAARKPQPSSK